MALGFERDAGAAAGAPLAVGAISMKVPPQRDFPPKGVAYPVGFAAAERDPEIVLFLGLVFLGSSWAVTLIDEAPKCPSPAFWCSAWKLRKINGLAGMAGGRQRWHGRRACTR
jgi:hypothetical protein